MSLAELPNGTKLYVANQGTSQATSSVSSLNVADLSSNPVTGFTGTNPVWIVARGDSQKIYVLTQGDGQLVTIDTATDTVSSSLPVGAGANFIFFDPNLNRLYVTNPADQHTLRFFRHRRSQRHSASAGSNLIRGGVSAMSLGMRAHLSDGAG